MPQLKPVKRRTFVKFLDYLGCKLVRIRRDHFIYSKPGLRRPVVITDDSEVSAFYIRSNLRTLGMTFEEFQEILRRL